MPPEEMTGSTHILEFMCYAIAGSAGIRFCMEMVMSSSSDASAQRRRRRVGRRSGVLRGLAGTALRAGARAASRARRGRGPGPGARRRAVGPDAVRAERGAQARQSQRATVVRSPPNLWCRWWSSGGRLNACETLVCALATVSVLATVQGLSSSRLGFGRRGIVCGSRRCFWLQ